MPRIAIVGCGNVGSQAAWEIAGSGLGDVVLIDVVEGLPQGRALDIAHALSLNGLSGKVTGTNDFTALAGADIVVHAAGLARGPGMSRQDLLEKNTGILGDVIVRVRSEAPESIVIVVSNPVDLLTKRAFELSGFPATRVIGMGSLLDSGRWRCFLAQAAGVPVAEVEAMVIGAHNDDMVPLVSQARIGERPAAVVLSPAALDRAGARARGAGAEIVGYLKTASAGFGPGAAVATMVKAIVQDEQVVLPVCCRAAGKYGLGEDVFIGLPVVLGADGIVDIIELGITAEEKAALQRAASRLA